MFRIFGCVFVLAGVEVSCIMCCVCDKSVYASSFTVSIESSTSADLSEWSQSEVELGVGGEVTSRIGSYRFSLTRRASCTLLSFGTLRSEMSS